jgi:hypothetical protein
MACHFHHALIIQHDLSLVSHYVSSRIAIGRSDRLFVHEEVTFVSISTYPARIYCMHGACNER